MSEEIEVLEKALLAVIAKYGYACLNVACDTESAQPWYANVTYPNASYTTEGDGHTLRAALSQASVDVLNNGAEAAE